ncbi:Ig-like domain-containing protein [Cryobacterium sp. PH29-G1]|uniref:Ig-like domain-containing protein n=1 Tax=Cryobacterium sp. PH29-G1 TaxID=3046211 RepID=UPI0024BB2411|nr:Ig-like domain-containing protein [Cryobacterium sp. PH29-G1]MDJ0347734.1 Ig-like domain-containing protein [Cryobacterium sp. PH29-G1]
MAGIRARRRLRVLVKARRGVIRIAAVAIVGALLATVAIVVDGFDVKQTPVNASSIWALQSGTGNRYARINTDLGELDTVKTVPAPSELVQTDSTVLLYAQNNEKVVDVSLAAPIDLGDDATDYDSTPDGTRTIVSSGSWVGYLTSTGTVFAGAVDATTEPRPVNPYADDEVVRGETPRAYRSDAIAITPEGLLYSYSSAAGSVLRYSIAKDKIQGEDIVTDGPAEPGSQLSVVGDSWALLAVAGDELWLAGQSRPVETKMSELAVLQRPSSSADDVFIADQAGLVAFALSDGARTALVGDSETVLGVPAAPTPFHGDRYAAWLPASGAGGTLFSEDSGESTLSYGAVAATGDAAPAFRANESLLILNDTQSGWVWTVPDGALVTGSQDWTLAEVSEPQRQDNVDVASEVVEPKAPVAVADAFGVRIDQLVRLPVLLNDHDANDDVLSVIPASVTGLDPSWGTVTVTDHNQTLAVQVAPGASGTATFSYAITDGSRTDGLDSSPATVTLTVHSDDVNSAPVWCGTDGCLQDWPAPEVQPGGSVSVPVLTGWVDPDGDPIFVASAVNTTDIGSVSVTPAGVLVYKHPNAAEQAAQSAPILVRVSDIHGAATEKVLTVAVTPTPRLTVEPFALVASVNEHLTVNPAEYVSGAAGLYRITSVTTPSSAEGSTVSSTANGTAFDFAATVVGNYTISLTIADDVSEVVSLVRISVVSADAQALTTSPVTVFVRPKADTSVDVFTAVSNPAGRVLLLGEAIPETAVGASLSVDVVGQNILRVRGSTADERPGKLGTVRYTVSDGTENPLYTVRGEATVYLLEASVPQAPIAMNDSVSVRVGAQIDIPVLDNDVAPDGNIVMLNAESVQNRSDLGLAFAAGGQLRYLAPDEPGSYELAYSVYTAGAPELIDSAVVSVEVLADGENTAPQPHTLYGRVLSGEAIEIPFDSFGIDPDGDTVVLDRVLSQPARGTASINATGDAIVYSSPLDFHGAIEFEYRVRDTVGATGLALVRIGVLDQRSNPSPITFSDYVEVQAGADNQVVVFPAANDIEPGGGNLSLSLVTPDAPAGTAEFDALAQRISSVTDDRVVFTAGTEPGLLTFVYSVTNANEDVGQGLIVVKVVRASVPDYPVVIDTTLALDERDAFPTGIDVVTDKVSWNSGDVGGLSLTLWGSHPGLEVSGWKISGDVPDGGLLAPFALTGPNFQGVVVTTYGFLRIPSKDAIIVALKKGNVDQKVREDASVTFDLKSLVSIPAGTTLELQRTGIRSSGERPNATCTLGSGTSVTYTAGSDAPWTDSCTVPARIEGQEDYTQLVVPVVVEPLDPQPELRPAALTQSPGSDPVRYDLSHMVDWQGKGAVPALTFAIEFASDQFTVTQNGPILSIGVADNAVAGREAAVTVSLSSHREAVPAVLALKVGPAPSELPKGGTVASTCTQSSGSSCSIAVVGAPGEVNLYRNTPLTLVSVTAPSTCVGVSFTVENSRNVRATWSGDTAGGVCEASFVVRDAQGKLSAGNRNGSITVDLQGYPKAPNAVGQIAYGDHTVTLSVKPGGANAAYPALTGFALYRGGAKVASCDTSGNCGVIRTTENGQKEQYEAKAVNSVGESRTAVNVTAWSYATPGMGRLAAEPIFQEGTTSASTGAVTVTIENTDRSTRGYSVNGTEKSVTMPGSGRTEVTLALGVGKQTVTVTPLSQFERPAGSGPTDQTESIGVQVAGSPAITSGGSLSSQNRSITVAGTGFNSNSSKLPVQVLYVASLTEGATCTLTPAGFTPEGASSSTDPAIGGLTKHTKYFVSICYSNGYGVTTANAGSITTWEQPAAPGNGTYRYDMAAPAGGKYLLTKPTSSTRVPSDFTADFDNFTETTGSSVFGADPGIRVRYCTTTDSSLCSDWSTVAAANADRAWQVRYAVAGLSNAGCVIGGTLAVAVDATSAGLAEAVVTGADYYVPDSQGGRTWAHRNGNTVPAGATQTKNVQWTLTWTAPQTSGLDPASGTTTSTAVVCSAATAPTP